MIKYRCVRYSRTCIWNLFKIKFTFTSTGTGIFLSILHAYNFLKIMLQIEIFFTKGRVLPKIKASYPVRYCFRLIQQITFFEPPSKMKNLPVWFLNCCLLDVKPVNEQPLLKHGLLWRRRPKEINSQMASYLNIYLSKPLPIYVRL